MGVMVDAMMIGVAAPGERRELTDADQTCVQIIGRTFDFFGAGNKIIGNRGFICRCLSVQEWLKVVEVIECCR